MQDIKKWAGSMSLKSDVLPAHSVGFGLFLAPPEFGQFDVRELLQSVCYAFAQLLHPIGYSGTLVLSAFRDGVARILRDVRGLVSGVLHSLGDGGAGVLRALRYRIAGVLDGVRGLLPGILQGLAGIIYGLARGLDPSRPVFDMQMNVLKLQCAGECIEITGDAFDVGNGMR